MFIGMEREMMSSKKVMRILNRNNRLELMHYVRLEFFLFPRLLNILHLLSLLSHDLPYDKNASK